MDSGLLAEPVIGPRFARTRWLGPAMTRHSSAARFDWGAGNPLSMFCSQKMRGSRAPTGAGAEAPHPMARLAVEPISGSPEITQAHDAGPGAPFGALLRRSPYGVGPRFPAFAPISRLPAGDRCVPERSPDAARVRAVRSARPRAPHQPRPGIAGRRLPDLRTC